MVKRKTMFPECEPIRMQEAAGNAVTNQAPSHPECPQLAGWNALAKSTYTDKYTSCPACGAIDEFFVTSQHINKIGRLPPLCISAFIDTAPAETGSPLM
jgi:hypothetical protein